MLKKYLTLNNLLTLFIMFVFIQSLFFKFSDSFETVFIFSTLGDWSGLEWFGNYGAYMVGTAELIASIILVTKFRAIGAVMALGIMTGAIFFHLATPLGVVQPAFDANGHIIGDDAGGLFIMACLVWLSALVLVIRDLRSQDSLLLSLLKQVGIIKEA
ncbi:hypothetical protein CBF23_001175 [Marinomonas agarivorans]|nr:hypothetical protein CBF23_001175 [Marinomonas agarivorans]